MIICRNPKLTKKFRPIITYNFYISFLRVSHVTTSPSLRDWSSGFCWIKRNGLQYRQIIIGHFYVSRIFVTETWKLKLDNNDTIWWYTFTQLDFNESLVELCFLCHPVFSKSLITIVNSYSNANDNEDLLLFLC